VRAGGRPERSGYAAGGAPSRHRRGAAPARAAAGAPSRRTPPSEPPTASANTSAPQSRGAPVTAAAAAAAGPAGPAGTWPAWALAGRRAHASAVTQPRVACTEPTCRGAAQAPLGFAGPPGGAGRAGDRTAAHARGTRRLEPAAARAGPHAGLWRRPGVLARLRAARAWHAQRQAAVTRREHPAGRPALQPSSRTLAAAGRAPARGRRRRRRRARPGRPRSAAQRARATRAQSARPRPAARTSAPRARRTAPPAAPTTPPAHAQVRVGHVRAAPQPAPAPAARRRRCAAAAGCG